MALHVYHEFAMTQNSWTNSWVFHYFHSKFILLSWQKILVVVVDVNIRSQINHCTVIMLHSNNTVRTYVCLICDHGKSVFSVLLY